MRIFRVYDKRIKWIDKIIWDKNKARYFVEDKEYKEKEVDEYIGKDKNENEVWENDYIKMYFKAENYDSKEREWYMVADGYFYGRAKMNKSIGMYLTDCFIVFENMENASFRMVEVNSNKKLVLSRSEVIGNVYENKNLLEIIKQGVVNEDKRVSK